MILLKLDPAPTSDVEKETIRQLIGFYRGTAMFSELGIISIYPKSEFNLEGLLLSLRTSGFTVETK